MATTFEVTACIALAALVDDETILMGREAAAARVGVATLLLEGVFPMNERMSRDPEPEEEVEGVEGDPEAAGFGTIET